MEGSGRRAVGAQRSVQTEDFEAVRQGLAPRTGEFLRQRHSADRVADGTTLAQARHLYDFTISAPKSVSIMAIPGGDNRLLAAHEKAVAEVMEELEVYAASRVRQENANVDRITGNPVLAIYHYDTSRELDPQIHTHAVAATSPTTAQKGIWVGLHFLAYYICKEKCRQKKKLPLLTSVSRTFGRPHDLTHLPTRDTLMKVP